MFELMQMLAKFMPLETLVEKAENSIKEYQLTKSEETKKTMKMDVTMLHFHLITENMEPDEIMERLDEAKQGSDFIQRAKNLK